MRRIHAFEFNDMSTCPIYIRESIIEILGDGLRRSGFYDAVADTFLDFCHRADAASLLDLCSGSGEPAAGLIDACRARGAQVPAVTLTDLFPNHAALTDVAQRYPTTIRYSKEPVDATQIPKHLDEQACSIICAFHHFPPELAQAIITEQVRNERAIFILEALPREPLRALPLIATLAPSYFANPWRTKSDRLRKFLAIYSVPAVALAGMWDAVVSALRSYREDEYRAMATQAGGDYAWTYREISFSPGGKAVAFYGIPLKSTTAR